jgi:hypothetical protein
MRCAGIALLLLFCGSEAGAQPALCAPYTAPIRLSFNTRIVDPTYNFDLSIQDVRQLYTVRGQRITRAHSNAIGLTYAEISISLGAATVARPRERSSYCVYLEEVEARFGFDKFDVYVGREYPAGSCEYRTILDHENEHVTIYKDVIRDYGGRIRTAIERELMNLGPVFVPSARAGGERAISQLQQRLQPTIDAFQAESRRRNGRIDTQSNYGALQELCPNWDRYRNF